MFLSKEVGNIITSNVLGILIFTGVLFISKQIDYSRSILVLFFLVNITITSIERFVVRKFIRRMRRKGFLVNVKYTVFVGYSDGHKRFNKLVRK